MSSGASDSSESIFGGFLSLSGIMQAPSCIISTIHGLGTAVGKGLMYLCQICAELLLIFYFCYQLLASWPSSKFFTSNFPVWTGMPSLLTLVMQLCIDALNPLPYDTFALIRCH